LTVLSAAALIVVGAVFAELVFPGAAVYHFGWYNVLLVAFVAVAFGAGRRQFARLAVRARLAMLALLAGVGVAGLAGAASGLLAPDNQTFVGAPGQRIAVESLGQLDFPIALSDARTPGTVTLERASRAPIAIGVRPRLTGNFTLRLVARSVVYVEARDLRGNRLTVTQPSGSVFLSPVLLMEHRQTIAGMDLPYDSFNVPAARRVVKAVMFEPSQAAMLLHGGTELGQSAVLFAVDDENEQPLAHAIALSAGGRSVAVGGLILRGAVEDYPAVEVAATPNVLAATLGTLLAIGGLTALLTRHDRPNVSHDDAARG
jgi:hypothetical protein